MNNLKGGIERGTKRWEIRRVGIFFWKNVAKIVPIYIFHAELFTIRNFLYFCILDAGRDGDRVQKENETKL